MVDDLDGEPPCRRTRERLGNVAIERFPCFSVDLGLQAGFERLVRIIRAHEIGAADEEALLVVIGVDEPCGDVALATGANLAGLGVEYVNSQNFDHDVSLIIEIPCDIGFAENDEQVACTGVFQFLRHMQVGVHLGLQDRQRTKLDEFRRMSLEIVFGPDTEPPLFPAPTTLDEVRPLEMRTIVRDTRGGRLWNEFVARYHYLGYKTLVGAQMRFAVHDRNGWPLAMLGFSTAAWKLAPRDRFIGWTPELREKNLPLVVDNPRFLILPWIEIPNLGSHILALVRRRLPQDWTERYNTAPVLIETFVETPRYTGAVYRASGWIHVGTTQGRGRYDRDKLYDKPRKDIWLRPLRRDWRRTLNR